ncbi:MAG: hypothetical protein K0S23_333 [Fluviicola sp.]|jgi:hypothetical protein|uniref:DUF1579 family protein n=1 Tax=Fluviicola sp. TaxID=1917219 RepID=UPI0026114B78|nr:DUF1579 family protein [Fluviicola sp.]MDF3026026.1 hypothetical protein [Fluviicola sp.]
MKDKSLEYEQLNRFVGKWKTTGKIPASGASPEINVSGSDTYEWLPGGFFLLHKVDVLLGDDKNETLEIIGFDKQRDLYTMQHYDNKGNSGFMTADYKDGVWTFLGDNLRFKGGFKKNDTEFSGVWEQSSDGKDWTHFMEIRLTK